MALDEKRGIVYVPTGCAASDFYGADRVGDDLFGNTLLALNADTGERIWHFQAVKHDMWDRDFPSPPSLVTVKRNGKTIDAVAQTTKQGWVYLFDRTNGQPLFPIEYKNYPQSTTPGEVSSPTQPLPIKPAPFARQLLTEDMLTTRTPEAHQWALDQFKTFRSEGQFVPLSVGNQTVVFPGFDGGAEWGGSAFDPESGLLYVNANDLPWTSGLAPTVPAGNSGRQVYIQNCASCHGDDLAGAPPQIPALVDIGSRRNTAELTAVVQQGSGRMPSFPGISQSDLRSLLTYLSSGEGRELAPGPGAAGGRAGAAAGGRGGGRGGVPAANAPPPAAYRFTGYRKFYDPDGYPAVVPPWGTLNAINLSTGEYAWKIPLGEYPALAAKGVPTTGTENYGGPIVTAGGLVFIGATNFDRKFRAFDKSTGKLLWEATLPFAGNATPATYEIDGRQYVVIYATGGKGGRGDPSGGTFVAFALPKGSR
jgi:quinoprotein glucose dehydrogenase